MRSNRALSHAESLFTRFAVCPHTNCCVKSRWRLIRITPVVMSVLPHEVCTGKHTPVVAPAAAINARTPSLISLRVCLLVLMGKLGIGSSLDTVCCYSPVSFILPQSGAKTKGSLTLHLPPPPAARPVIITGCSYRINAYCPIQILEDTFSPWRFCCTLGE